VHRVRPRALLETSASRALANLGHHDQVCQPCRHIAHLGVISMTKAASRRLDHCVPCRHIAHLGVISELHAEELLYIARESARHDGGAGRGCSMKVLQPRKELWKPKWRRGTIT